VRAWGFDAIRLPIHWSGIEPTETGGFDEAYLARIDAFVALAAKEDLFVLLDLHQDAYSKEIGEDGAPLWAIEPKPSTLREGPLTDLDARRQSNQVLDAFATFFGAGPDGARLRGRFVTMAKVVAARFAAAPNVVGLEIFNEPVTDTAGLARLDALAYPALRAAAPDKLYVFEPNAVRNFLDQAPTPASPLGPMSGYAPHVYTLSFTGTAAQFAAMTKDTLRRSNENARAEADAWNAPLLVGEWGMDPRGPRASTYLAWQSELQDEARASSFFWLWKEDSQGSWGCFDRAAPGAGAWTERTALRRALARVRPAAIAGLPERFGYDAGKGSFELTFTGDPDVVAPHLIVVPELLGPPLHVRCDGADVPYVSQGHGTIAVRCGSTPKAHRLEVAVAP
jgi:endoglycosylceramidase